MTTTFRGQRACDCRALAHAPSLVAVTGGPGAGKTAVLELATRACCPHVGILREAAGIVFGGGFPRRGTSAAQRAAQRAIFHVQRELEWLALESSELGLVLCDRGTIDGLAYWPGEADDYWRDVGSTRAYELSRYAAVIHLDTPADGHGYNHDNELRIESAQDARALDLRIRTAWGGHPRRCFVPSTDDFVAKASQALAHIMALTPACCRAATADAP